MSAARGKTLGQILDDGELRRETKTIISEVIAVERDLFAGAMIRMGDELGIEVPGIRKITAVLDERKPLVS